ncbi:hypothetical protein MIDIC_230093 [Alphaproteobacteria bacterium]
MIKSKVKHLINGRVKRMNNTIKDATFHIATHEQLKILIYAHSL